MDKLVDNVDNFPHMLWISLCPNVNNSRLCTGKDTNPTRTDTTNHRIRQKNACKAIALQALFICGGSYAPWNSTGLSLGMNAM